MVVMMFLILLSLCSFSTFAMEEMMLVLPDGKVSIPLTLADKFERLRLYRKMAFDVRGEAEQLKNKPHIIPDPMVYNFVYKPKSDERPSYVPTEKEVLHYLVYYVENPDEIITCSASGDFLQKMFILADYLGAPKSVSALLMRRVINAIGPGRSQMLRPETYELINNYLKHSIKQGYLDFKGSGFSRTDGLLALFDKNCYMDSRDALDGKKIMSVDLSHNQLAEVDISCMVKIFPLLIQVDLNHNQIKAVNLKMLPHGFRLDVSDNQLQKILLNNGQKALSLNCSRNMFSADAVRAAERALNRGMACNCARRGIALISFFNPEEGTVYLIIVVISNYFIQAVSNSLANLITCDEINQLSSNIINKNSFYLIVGWDLFIFGSTVLAHRVRPIAWKKWACFKIGFFRLLDLFKCNPIKTRLYSELFGTFYGLSHLNDIIGDPYELIFRGMQRFYNRFCLPLVARMNLFIDRNRNRFSFADQQH